MNEFKSFKESYSCTTLEQLIFKDTMRIVTIGTGFYKPKPKGRHFLYAMKIDCEQIMNRWLIKRIFIELGAHV